jgi:hypothetical protein
MLKYIPQTVDINHQSLHSHISRGGGDGDIEVGGLIEDGGSGSGAGSSDPKKKKQKQQGLKTGTLLATPTVSRRPPGTTGTPKSSRRQPLFPQSPAKAKSKAIAGGFSSYKTIYDSDDDDEGVNDESGSSSLAGNVAACMNSCGTALADGFSLKGLTTGYWLLSVHCMVIKEREFLRFTECFAETFLRIS